MNGHTDQPQGNRPARGGAPRRGGGNFDRRGRHGGNRGRGRGGPRQGGGGGGWQDRGPAIDTISSPYNFVGVDNNVAPADTNGLKVSHHAPFQTGWSGWIDLEIKATTPIYIRGAGDFRAYRSGAFAGDCRALVGRADNQRDIGRDIGGRHQFKEFTDFYRLPDGRPAIPATSIRGVFRNLIEILTNSRLGPVNDRRYAVRDLNNPDRSLYGDWMSDSSRGTFEPRVLAGWLSASNGQWFITPCEFARVEQEDLERFAPGRPRLGERGPLKKKYAEWKKAGMNTAMNWQIGPLTAHRHSRGNMLRYCKATPVRGQGTDGTLVFTGQPMARVPGKPGRKHLEFVFFNDAPEAVPVGSKQKRDFLQTHTDESDRPSESWAYWKSRLASGERVPVFYLAYPSDKHAQPGQRTIPLSGGSYLHSFGLALMFRLAYKDTLKDAIPEAHRKTPGEGAMDFTEALFGYQREKADEGLRGRLAFGPCVADRDAHQLPPVITVLGSPKPTYYPNYLNQTFDQANPRKLQQGKNYHTLMNAGSELRGWKFYPAHPDGRDPRPDLPLPPANDRGERNYDTATAFRPLDTGTTFKGRLRFHNLRPAELGALVWALTWGGNGSLRHRIGMAKPLGYGCAKISLAGGRLVPNDPANADRLEWQAGDPRPAPLDEAVKAFEELFQSRLQGPDIQHDLLGMASPDHDVELRYPRLDRPNEFAEAKKAKLVLPHWRVLAGGSAPAPTAAPAAATGGGGGGGAAYAVGQIVECEVVKKQEGKQKASLRIAGGRLIDSGGLHPDAKARFAEIPDVGQTIKMKVAVAGAGSYQFDFPD